MNQSACTHLDGSLKYADFSDADVADALKIVAAVLHVGNEEFVSTTTTEGNVAQIKDRANLATTAALLGVRADQLALTLCEETLVARNKTFQLKRTKEKAQFARDAFAKTLFNSLFLYVVQKIATSLGKLDDSAPFIGILDIFGFEVFQVNDFEQLLINYANEALPATFNKAILVAEMELFRQEGIEVPTIAVATGQFSLCGSC